MGAPMRVLKNFALKGAAVRPLSFSLLCERVYSATNMTLACILQHVLPFIREGYRKTMQFFNVVAALHGFIC